MNRRKAVLSIVLGGGALVAGFAGYKWQRLTKTPDFNYLENNGALLGDLAEAIIPSTDVPGAREAGVGSFLSRMVTDVCDRKSQNNFIDGLKDLVGYTASKYNKTFSELDAQQQGQVLSHFRDKGKPYGGKIGKVEARIMGKSFFTILREGTIMGYCRSRQGATRLLAYDIVPGRYDGCIPMTPGQRAWATF